MRHRWLLCWLLFAATALSFLDRQVLSVLAPRITAEFAMSNEAYSRVVFAFQASYTVMFALGGRFADLVGTRIGMAACLAVWSVASAAHAFTRGAASLDGRALPARDGRRRLSSRRRHEVRHSGFRPTNAPWRWASRRADRRWGR